MNEEELDRAMQYGSRNPRETREAKDLECFGLGLKTASLSQCSCLSIISNQGDDILGRHWDIDHVAAVGDWPLIILDKEDISSLPQIEHLMQAESGTLVVWQKWTG